MREDLAGGESLQWHEQKLCDGEFLLDLNDPSKLIGRLGKPILKAVIHGPKTGGSILDI
jgi:hypothetical protein